jgi:hypothetical protein
MWHIGRVIQVAVLREAECDQLDVQFLPGPDAVS